MATEQPKDRRDDFLLEMYRQTSSHLNRHILLSWQSVGVVAGALTVFVVGDKLEFKADPKLDFVIGVVVLLCAWSIAHVFDANNWFERNLHIIANIERQFLKPTDSAEIHYYFTKHRRDGSERIWKGWLIEHFQIQMLMALCLWVLLIAFHFYQRVYPGFSSSMASFEPVRGLPYLVTLVSAAYCYFVAKNRKEDYERLLGNSPGKAL